MYGSLSHAQIENLLSSNSIGRIGFTDGSWPFIIPVTYAYDGEFIYAHTNPGEKLDMMRINPRVCFEIERITDMDHWQTVVIHGIYEELINEEDIRARDILFQSVFPLNTGFAVHPSGHGDQPLLKNENQARDILYRIRIEKMTGRYNGQS